MRRKINIIFSLFLIASCMVPHFGCIRLGAATWHQGAGDEGPKVKSVGIDTQKMMRGDQVPHADITV